ncbi:MAG TPA: hypothetical protein VNZ48_16510 [Xanthobacteraceae bacterium]|jgi:hypothetical protein|nr:hypothetical protein [Xanthobacteraceae bacterium]
MPNVTISASASPRLDGDFQITPNADYAASAADEDLFAAIKAALDRLAQHHQADMPVPASDGSLPTPMSRELLAARKTARTIAAASIQAEAQKFAAGRTEAADAAEQVRKIEGQYLASVPTFGVADRLPARFESDFQIVLAAGCVPNNTQATYFDYLERALAEITIDQSNDSTGHYSPFVIEYRKARRMAAVKTFRAQAEKFCAGELSANSATESLLLARGGYHALRDRLTRRLFNASIAKEDDKKYTDRTDLSISLISGLPPPEDDASPEKQDLYVQISKATTVIRTVCSRIEERAESGWRKRFNCPDQPAKERARYLLGDYMEKLHGIAVIGLENSYTSLAKLALAELRNEFFVREAGRIKNKYVRRLGAWAGIAALAFLVAHVVILTRYPDWAWGQMHKAFLVAAAGASIGTWASFSVRQVQFSFDDLVMLEENSLDPPLRILFVVALTLTACLLFWTGAINLEIGNLKTQQDSFRSSGTVAVLIGMFAGLSERALATAISGRATAFVKSIGGGT